MSDLDFNSQIESNLSAPQIDFTPLFGTLEIDGDGTYYIFLKQNRTSNTWVLTEQEIFDKRSASSEERLKHCVAILKSYRTGRLEGLGKTYLLTRLMSNISTMMYLCINKSFESTRFITSGEYSDENSGSYIRFKSSGSGNIYLILEMVYEGFRLSMTEHAKSIPFRIPKLETVIDHVSKAAIVTNLGVKTAASLFKSMGDRLGWYKNKRYSLVDTVGKFKMVMLDFLRSVQAAADSDKSVLVGLDTETTGLNMLNLEVGNPLRDNVVAIPFAWRENEAFLICTDMYYFSNVDSEEIYPLFTTLFRRNPDFTFQDIELDYCGEHFKFNRKNITVAGWNVMFDERAFFTEGADVFFDEDGRQLYFNLDTDLQQGQAGFEKWGTFQLANSLKMQTRRMIGDETLELVELFGPKNEDKFRYLQDPVLANLYGGADADYTRKMVRLGIQLTDRKLYSQYRKYDMCIAYLLAKAAWNGMPINSQAVKDLGELVRQDLEQLKDFIYHYAWIANRDTLKEKTDRLCDLLGLDSSEQLEEVVNEDKMFRYPFTPANHKKLLFQMLGYPVIKRSSKNGDPALDKFVLEKLMNVKKEHPVEVMLEDVMSISDPGNKLIDKDKFNHDAYPLARVFSTYATLNKEYTSYYKPLLENDTENRMFYDFTMARAATRRILSPGQTMKKSLKKLVIAPPGQIFMSFDASQIEYRHMASLAYIRTKNQLQRKFPNSWESRLKESSIFRIFDMMQKEEADYHIETAAAMTGVKQHEVTSDVRKRYKCIGFGIPYGLGDRSLCESLHKGVVNEENMRNTRELLKDYDTKQKEIIDLLESVRDSAFVPAQISDEYRKYLGVGDSHVGIVHNFTGFYRLFILENLTRKRTARIRRQAGNCIIQGGAAELFRRMLYNFHIGCCKYDIQDKVHWIMTVHDELDATVDADIDILLLIKVLHENCTLYYQDHIPYYIGINFGANWYDAKADANELPVIMVKRMISAYDAGIFSIPSDGHQAESLLKLKKHYLCDRIAEELDTIIPGLCEGHVWTDEEVQRVDNEFSNYVVRAYLDVFSSSKDLKEKLDGWQKAREDYGFGVDFLNTKLVSYREADIEVEDEMDFSLDSELDLSIDLLDNTPEEELMKSDSAPSWFDEKMLFDQNLREDEIVVDADESVVFGLQKEESDLEVNEHPTSAFDVFVSTKYKRTKVLKISEGIYSVILNGSDFEFKQTELCREIKKRFASGGDTLLVIGPKTYKISNVSGTEDDLNWLDKILCGTEVA